jgi:hypothetical protein
MKNEIKTIFKFSSGIILGIALSLLMIREVTGSNIILSIPSGSFRLITGIFLGLIGSWITFYLSVFIWRQLLVYLGFMTNEESHRSPFYTGFEMNRTKSP